MQEREPDGASPFEDHECGHLPCPSWLHAEEAVPQPVAVGPQAPPDEPELDAPYHLHTLWVALGLGET